MWHGKAVFKSALVSRGKVVDVELGMASATPNACRRVLRLFRVSAGENQGRETYEFTVISCTGAL